MKIQFGESIDMRRTQHAYQNSVMSLVMRIGYALQWETEFNYLKIAPWRHMSYYLL